VLTCYPGLHALTLHRLAIPLEQRFPLARALYLARLALADRYRDSSGARVGHHVFSDTAWACHRGNREIGDGTTIYQGVTLAARRLRGAPSVSNARA